MLLMRVYDTVRAHRHFVSLTVVRQVGEMNGARGGRNGRLVGRDGLVSAQSVGSRVYLLSRQTYNDFWSTHKLLETTVDTNESYTLESS